jgi:hypothetical protein
MQKRPGVQGRSVRRKVLRQRRIYTRFADVWEALRAQADELRRARKPRIA